MSSLATEDYMTYSNDDVETNPTSNPTIESIIQSRYSRRQTLKTSLGLSAAAAAPMMLAACGNGNGEPAPTVSVGSGVQTSAGRVVTLTGTVDSGTVTGVTWTQTSGPPVTLASADRSTTTFVAPGVAAATPLQFSFNATGPGGQASASATVNLTPAILGFTPVAKSLADVVSVPAGYTVTVLYALGDPIAAGVAAFANNGTDANYAQRAGDHHDGLYYFGLAATGTAPDPANSTRGILCINHENITQRYLHPNGATNTNGVRPTAEVQKEMEAHGVSVIEITRSSANGTWSYAPTSSFNRRITPYTPTVFSGPARGAAAMRTLYSPTGVAGRGTINNCAGGYTAWNSYITAEENWSGYFQRGSTDWAARTAKEHTSLSRYGRGGAAGNNGAYGWTTAPPLSAGDTSISKFNMTIDPTKAADGTGDFRYEHNQYGWIVEIDPYDPRSAPRKRTALGRMNHEGAWPGRFVAGVKPAWYMGDDANGEYIYKFVSNAAWVAADASNVDRLATGDKYLDAGTLYVARFNADGTGQWFPLVFGQGPLTPANTVYPFADQADVLINTRLAGDALGATRMDRPEWTAVNPKTGEMYCTLTNGAARGTTTPIDAANPRVYVDAPSTARGNRNGHIIRLRENGDTTEATAFTWDIYVFAAGSDLDAVNINVSALTADNDMSSPDGLWFSRNQNAGGIGNPLLWVQTDDGAFTDVTNCMMLVGQPGQVGDGGTRTITSTLANGTVVQQATRVGALPGTNLRRFLVGPKECEITGIDSTPDGRTIFVNIQHPGEDTTTGFPNTFPSNWPASQTNATAVSRPRSATIVITKNDGGVVGV